MMYDSLIFARLSVIQVEYSVCFTAHADSLKIECENRMLDKYVNI